MEQKKRFSGYRARLGLEGALRASLYGIGAGALGVLVTSLVYHILIREPEPLLLLSIFFALFLLTALTLFFARYYPSIRRTAARIDRDIELDERVETMVEFWDREGTLVELQRSDALGRLENTSPSQLKFRLEKKCILSVICSVLLAAAVLLVPYDIFAVEPEESEDLARAEWVSELLEELREEAQNLEEDELKSAVEEILNELEEALANAQSELERAAGISEAKISLQELLDSAVSRDEIGEALQRFELTGPLGEVISAGDTEGVPGAMEDLFGKLDSDNSLILTLHENINEALALSGVDSGDALYTALNDFAVSMAMIPVSSDGRLQTAFDAAEEAIIEALLNQAETEEYLKSIADSLEDAMDEISGESQEAGESQESGEEPEGEKPEGEKPEGEMPEGEMPEGDPPEDMPQGMGGNGEEINDSMNESFYDPLSGAVEYGDVFASYYNKYLEAIAQGEISDELQEIIDNYFEAMNR